MCFTENLSNIVVFADILFANIAGQSAGNKKDLVQIQAGHGAASSYRNTWKENFSVTLMGLTSCSQI